MKVPQLSGRFRRLASLSLLAPLAALPVGPPRAAAADGHPPPLRQKCGDAYGILAQPAWLRADDGVRLYALESGKGRVGVVLAHESPGDLCGWLPYIAKLTHARVRVLAFDFRGFGNSQAPPEARRYYAYDHDFRAAVDRLRAEGATRIFAIGASFGGAALLMYAPRLPLAGVISLSGETSIPGRRIDALATIGRLRSPLLIVGSRHDHYLPVEDALRLLRTAGSKDKRTALYPGAYHGWNIVEDAPYAAKARALLLRWLHAH